MAYISILAILSSLLAGIAVKKIIASGLSLPNIYET